MFISSNIKKAPGIKDELKVWNMLKQSFSSELAFAIHHYPMFYSSGAVRREIDILFVHKQLGLFIIEVKGLEIDQIEKIQAHWWHFKNFRTDKEAPYQQAFNQMMMLTNDLENKVMLPKQINRFAVVALPRITRQQWCKRGFDKELHIPSPILQDDLASPKEFIKKLQSLASDTKKRILSDQDWKRVKKYFNLDTQQLEVIDSYKEEIIIEPDVTEVHLPSTYKVNYQPDLFSRLYVLHNVDAFEDKHSEVEALLNDGVKIYILSYSKELSEEFKNGFPNFKDKFMLNVYTGKSTSPVPAQHFDNGKKIEHLIDQLSKEFKEFNKGQYEAIHCDATTQEMITAGAGTGKTHVMIDRILYLITVERVKLNDIIMITFTNASTNEMKERLENKFIELYDLTNHSRYLAYAEDVREMQISTIHAFAKVIIKKLAHELGLGQNVSLRSYTYEKKLIIQQLIDDYFKNKSGDFFKKHDIRYYEFINFSADLWDEMEKKGLSQEEIEKINWGIPNKKSKEIQALFEEIFSKCETELDRLKQQENAITIGDLIRRLKDFTKKSDVLKQLNPGCFLFVDEFQDSDDVQIEFIAKLQEILNYNLFVVGDVKQSVYRFRGADYRSFDELEKRKKASIEYKKIPLQHNYRSSQSLLNEMHQLFEVWGNLKDSLLAYESEDELISFEKSEYGNSNWHIVKYKFAKEWKKKVRDVISEAVQTRKDNKRKVALLVRTNNQAKRMKAICDELEITTTENLDGTFFTSLAVKHFAFLIQGLLYPNESKFLINALQTPYFNYRIPYQVLLKFQGDKASLANFISIKTNNILQSYVNLLRDHSPMTVIQKLVYESSMLSNLQGYFEQQGLTADMAKIEALQYELNFQHLMNLIEKTFSQQQLSLFVLLNWLTLQMNTNRNENEPTVDTDLAPIVISTVHRAKGLEYDTVILPITYEPYNKIQAKIFIQDRAELLSHEPRGVGWQLNKYGNNIYEELSQIETLEQKKEEVRLLYVAFTRAKQRVIVISPEIANDSTWAQLLLEAGL